MPGRLARARGERRLTMAVVGEAASATVAAAQGSSERGVLREAIHRARMPSLAGIAYEAMGLAWIFGALAALTILSLVVEDKEVMSSALARRFAVPKGTSAIVFFALAAPLILTATRVGAGLARMAAPGAPKGRKPTARNAWRSGISVQVSAFGIWLQIFGMMASATFVLIGPLVGLSLLIGPEALGPFSGILSGLALTLTFVYGAELGALQELATASLVRHRRGVGSAVLHAWRLMKSKPSESRRKAAADFAARFAVVAGSLAVAGSMGSGWGLALFVAIAALVGSVRCQAWSLQYPRLGGLEPQVLSDED